MKKNKYKGNLVLGIYCRDCDAQFELNAASIAGALVTKCSVWEYIEWIQNSTCPSCKKEKKDD